MSPAQVPQAASSHRPERSSWLVRYLKRLAITFIAMSIVSGVAEQVSKADVIAINTEIVNAIHKFDFPAVMSNTLDLYYTHETRAESIPYSPRPDDFLGRRATLDRSVIYVDEKHFSWWHLLVLPVLGLQQAISLLWKSWNEGILSFCTMLLALVVGGLLTERIILWLRNGEKSKRDPYIAAWLAPFVGGLFLWGLQLVILVPFVLLGKLLVNVQTIVAFSATAPLVHGLIQSAMSEKTGAVPTLIDTVKAEREHSIAAKIEEYLEKAPLKPLPPS